MPFVKKATVSLFDEPLFYLDGYANLGFSGGPVVYPVTGTQDYRVAAVISGWEEVPETVLEGEEDTKFKIMVNTGIIASYSIKEALNLIHNNPIGFNDEK